MKKIMTSLLALILLATVFLTSCNSQSSTTPSASPSEQSSNEQSNKPIEVDGITSASVKESSDSAKIIAGLSESGYWIFAVLSDVTLNEELVVSGEFHNKDDANDRLYRKFSLYAQNEQHQVTAEYTLTVPLITVLSPNFRIQNGTIKGDIFVDADGFELYGCTLDGNLTFKTQEQMDSADIMTGTVTGTITVAG
ncbi:MAG: hypothetical protein FWG88_09780 [Oscillospiraceae bacterium]|nr:hypothetical protein [Oscillospiraceae bacterium]